MSRPGYIFPRATCQCFRLCDKKLGCPAAPMSAYKRTLGIGQVRASLLHLDRASPHTPYMRDGLRNNSKSIF